MRRIEAIETSYRGRYFRSRLEARWAVFFDLIGLPWEYEMVGMQVGEWRYLPDFNLPTAPALLEVKPLAVPNAEEARLDGIIAAMDEGGRRFYVLRGVPDPREHRLYAVGMERWRTFRRCRRCLSPCFRSCRA